ncbi:MAG: MMPL family transporter [Candidatus Lindowbacteria bacterium]|nr:MMPL family transporter [Candidatus Lindowbacteria bacterium]
MRAPRLLLNLISKRPWAVLGFSVVLTVVLAAGIPKLTMRPFFEGDLPPNDPILRANENYSSYFGKDEVAYLELVHDTVYRPSTLAKIVAITDDLNGLDNVLKEETLSLATVRRVKWGAEGLDVRKYLSPLPGTPEEVERLRQDVRNDSEINGRLVSADESSTLLAIKLDPGYNQQQLYKSLHAIADKYSGPERIYPFGYQIMNEEANIGIGHDARILGPVSLLLMGSAIFVFFRSFRLTLSSTLMVLISIVWTIGIMHYLGFPLSILSSSIPAVLIVQGTSYAIHVIHSTSEETARTHTADNVLEGVGKISRALLLAAGMSMFGFATLVVFKILSIREFGICVAIGVGFATFLSLVVLPSIMILQKGIFKTGKIKESDSLDRILGKLALVGLKHKYAVVVTTTLVVAGSIIGILKIKVGVAPEEIFPPRHRAREVVSLFLREFHGPYNLNVMFTASEPGELKSPEVLKQIDDFQKFAESLSNVKYATSVVNLIKRMNRILNEDKAEFLKIPDSEEMVAQLLLIHSLTHDPVQYESMVDYDLQRCKVAIMTTAIDSSELEEVYDQLAAYCERNLKSGLRADFGGRSMVWIAQNEYIIRGKIMNIATNVIPVFIMCAFAFRSVRLGLAFGLMGHFGIRLDMATAVLTGICVGVGVDSAIHFISRLKRESLATGQMHEAVRRVMLGTGRAIVFDAIANSLGFVTFMFSGFTPIRTLGVLVCFTMLSCLTLTLILIPSIIALIPVPFRHPREGTIFLHAQDEQTEEEKYEPSLRE